MKEGVGEKIFIGGTEGKHFYILDCHFLTGIYSMISNLFVISLALVSSVHTVPVLVIV